jgi:hypothetical protein
MQLVDDGDPPDVADRKKLPEIIVVAHRPLRLDEYSVFSRLRNTACYDNSIESTDEIVQSCGSFLTTLNQVVTFPSLNWDVENRDLMYE